MEGHGQHPLNWLLDTPGDLLANSVGVFSGLRFGVGPEQGAGGLRFGVGPEQGAGSEMVL